MLAVYVGHIVTQFRAEWADIPPAYSHFNLQKVQVSSYACLPFIVSFRFAPEAAGSER